MQKVRNIALYIRDYIRFDLKRELRAWLRVGKFYLPTLVTVAVIATTAFVLVKPDPKKATYLAIGQHGSLTDLLGKHFVRYFQKNNLNLNVENMVGLEHGLQKLDANDSRINATFLTAGTASSEDYPDLVSLGSVQIAPLWFFYRGDRIVVDDPFEYFRDRKIAVGAIGTVTNKLFNRLMEINNPGTGDKENFLKIPHVDAAQQLRAGMIDAAFIVDGYSSPVIQSLLNDRSIRLINFPLADAYTRKLPFLQKVIVPKAAFNIQDIRPASEITLLASSVNLLVEKDLHPAIQWSFILATQDFDLKTEHFFTNSGRYPAYQDKSFPLSEVADRYFTSGIPTLFNYLPLWFAALIDNIWVGLLAIFFVGLPLFRKIMSFRGFASQKLLWEHFWELRYLEDDLANCHTREEIQKNILKLEELDQTVATTWVKSSDLRHYYNIQRCIAATLQNARKQLEKTK
jgi:TRAP-type uncharacterized transport system substrate-binding protein